MIELLNKFSIISKFFLFIIKITVVYFFYRLVELYKVKKITGSPSITIAEINNINKFTYLANIIFAAIVLYIMLSSLGVNNQYIATYLSGFLLVIAYSLQDFLNNVFSGLIILFNGTYRLDDFIFIENTYGWIVNIGITHVLIRSANKEIIAIPNNYFISRKIKNYSIYQKSYFEIKFGVRYGSDFQKIKKFLNQILDEYIDKKLIYPISENDTRNRKPITIELFDKSSVNINFRFLMDVSNFYTVYFEIYERIYEYVQTNEIPIPFPQLDVHIKD